MPSSHQSGNQKMRREREPIGKCRGDYNKKKSGSRDHKSRCKNAKSGFGCKKNSYYEATLQKFPQHNDFSSKTRFKDNRRESTTENSSSPPTIRSPWASPQRSRPRSLWFRSPVRQDRQECQKLPINQSSPGAKQNTQSEISNNYIDHFDSDNESGYVYEKIEGWDTDTDEETPTTK